MNTLPANAGTPLREGKNTLPANAGTPLREGNSPSMKGCQTKSDRVVGGFSLAEFIIGLFLLLILIAGSLLLLRPAKNIWFEGEQTVSSQTESRNSSAFFSSLS